MSSTLFDSPFGARRLLRRPRRPREVLQAWDAADHYLLNAVAERKLAAGARLLVVNDRFGALTLSLSNYCCDSWSDSVVAHLATAENAARNELARPTEIPATELPKGPYELVLFKLPKSHSLLRFQLRALISLRCEGAELIAATMAKHLSGATVAALESVAGPVQVSLAWKKARLVHFPSAASAPAPEDDRAVVEIPERGQTLINRANVFSRGKLDRGSRLLVDTLDGLALGEPLRVADLGCGNGLLGMAALARWRSARVDFFDESYLAVDSARQNLAGHYPDADVGFFADDCMSQYRGPKYDLVLCNPPFHQEYELGDHIARQMFADSYRQLKPGGQLIVVGNRHLGYHGQLRKRFGNVELLRSDAKFVVLSAKR